MQQLDPRREVGFQIIDSARLLKSFVERRLRAHGMTRTQWSVLLRLERQEGQMQVELADALEVQPIALVRLIDRLCEQGLIERRPDPRDRRANRLFLTQAGRARLAAMAGFRDQLANELLDGIDDAALKSMLRIFETLRANIKRAGADDAPGETRHAI